LSYQLEGGMVKRVTPGGTAGAAPAAAKPRPAGTQHHHRGKAKPAG
jgi:hypothetical protein